MSAIKLTAVTKGQLESLEVRPVNVEDYTEETINDCFPEVKLLGSFSRGHGTIVRQIDPIAFRLCCCDQSSHNVADKRWVEIDGDFYDVDNIINALEDADFEVENDL